MTEPTTCTAIQEMFSARQGNELAPAAVSRFEQHLAGCPACAKEWAYFQESQRWLAALPAAPVPANFLPGIHAKLARPSGFTAWLAALHHRRPTLAISSLAALAMLLLFLSPARHLTPTPSEQLAENIMAPATSRPALPPPSSPAPQLALEEPIRPIVPVAQNSFALFTADRAVQDLTSYRLTRTPTAMPQTYADTVPVRPDLSFTVHAASRESQALLYDRLLTQTHWRVAPAPRSGMLFLFMDAGDLPLLRHSLAPHRVTVADPDALERLAATNGMLAVALHLQGE